MNDAAATASARKCAKHNVNLTERAAMLVCLKCEDEKRLKIFSCEPGHAIPK